MLQAMYNGVSAMNATQQQMDVIGNNIANVNTDGFKASTVSFASQLSDTLQGATAPSATTGGSDPIQIGLGVSVGSTSVNTSQGALTSTSTPTDMAINGNGFFQLAGPNGTVNYTRDGHFALDSTGQLVQADTGQPVLGWQADSSGAINTAETIGPANTLTIGVGTQTTAKATSDATFTGNLSADDALGSSYTRNVNVYDSLGGQHTLTLTFSPVSNGATPPGTSNTWDWTATGDPGLAAASGTTNQGTITFNGSGDYLSQTGAVVLNPQSSASQGQAINIDFSALTQLSGSDSAAPSTQNGFASGTLQSFAVDQNGIVNGTFSNGQTEVLGQIALANVANPGGLNAIGSNEYSTSPDSGAAITSVANQNGLGSIQTAYLEQSNVDLGTEFTNMIVAQRSFEANTKIVSTVDQMLSDLVQMASG